MIRIALLSLAVFAAVCSAPGRDALAEDAGSAPALLQSLGKPASTVDGSKVDGSPAIGSKVDGSPAIGSKVVGSKVVVSPAVGPTAADLGMGLAGSNTVGEVLAPELVKAWMASLRLQPQVRDMPDPVEHEIVGRAAERPDALRVSIGAHGTGTGIEPLVNGNADIWMASRPANPSEIAKAEAAGLGHLRDPTNEHTIALDGVLVIVNRANPLQRLTIAELRDVFSGKITRWSEIGGPDAPIGVYARDDASGTLDTFSALVLRGQKLISTAKRLNDSDELSDEVAGDPNGIGFVSLAYQRNAKPLGIATACGLTISANAFAVKAGEYPLSRKLFMYTGEKTRQVTSDFLNYAQSLGAQSVVGRAGFIDFELAVADSRYAGERLDRASDALDGGQTTVRATDIEQFEEATRGADRIATTFRFQPGSDQLDAQAADDLERLAGILRRPELAQAHLVLIGFTQSQGDYRLNREISRQRARTVAAKLEAKQVAVAKVVGVGPAAPIACNTDDGARSLNQRVEVWVQRSQKP